MYKNIIISSFTLDLVLCAEGCPKEKPYCNCLGRCDARNQSECTTGSVSLELYCIFIIFSII